VSPEQRDLPEWRRAAERAKSRWAAAKNFRPEPADSKSWNGQYEAVRRSERSGTRLALSLDEAAAALGVSRAFFDTYIAPGLPLVRRGRRKLVAVRELNRWLENSAHGLPEGDRR